MKRSSKAKVNLVTTRLHQILITVLAILSLGAGSVSACTCSHHEESQGTEVQESCQSHHDSHEGTSLDDDVNVVDDSCVCSVNQRSPVAISKGSPDFKTFVSVAPPPPVVLFVQLTRHTTPGSRIPALTYDHFKSDALTSLLPSRAPPRL